VLKKHFGFLSTIKVFLLAVCLTFLFPAYSRSVIDAQQQEEIVCKVNVAIGVNDVYAGKGREGCKTSLYHGQYESFETLDKMYKTLPDDDEMLEMGLGKYSNQRVDEEKRNVTIRHAFLYAYEYEKKDDHDYHLIIGTAKEGILFTAECSGLPEASSADYKALLDVRKKLKCFIAQKPGEKNRSWTLYDPPIPIEISGSLFYDIDHAPGAAGPKGYRPETSWEIHPISNIKFFK
jgi:hypothetical protein